MFIQLRKAAGAIVSVALAFGTLSGASFAGQSFVGAVASADHTALKQSESDVDVALPTLAVAPTEATIATGTTDVEFTVELTNPTEGALAGGDVQLSVSREAVTSRNDFTEGSEGTSAGEQGAAAPEGTPEWLPIGTATIASAPASSNRTETVSVPRSELPFSEGGEISVYMIQAEYIAAPEQTSANQPAQPDSLTASTPVIVQGTITQQTITQQQLNSTVIVPLVFPEEVWSLPSRSDLDELFAEDATLPTLLEAAERTRATLAIDPRILVSIRGYADDAPEAAQQFLADLEASRLPSFLLQFGDADIAAQASVGRENLLAPTGASWITRFAINDALEADATEAARPEPEQSEQDQAVEDSETEATDPPTEDDAITEQYSIGQLAAWDETAGATAWPADGEINDATVSLIKSGEIEQLIVQDDNVTREGGSRAEVSGLQSLITDQQVNAEVSAAMSSSSETLQNLALARSLALTALQSTSQSTNQARGLVFSLDRGAVAISEDPAAVLDKLSAAPWLNFVDAQQQPEGRATLDAQNVNTDRADQLRAALERESTVRRVGDTLVHPEYLTDYHRMRLQSLFATRWATDLGRFGEVAEDFRERDTELMNGVEVIGGSLTQVFGSSSRIPVQIRNSLPFEAVVHGLVEPANGALTVESTDLGEIRIPAGESTTVLIPIQSRVTSGDSGIVVTMNAANGSRTISTQTFDVSITSQVETVAVFVLLVGAVLFVGFGVWRSVKRRRRTSAESAS